MSLGKKVTVLQSPVYLLGAASAVGGEEYAGPLGAEFDFHDPSDKFGASTWERAESELAGVVFSLLLKKTDTDHRLPGLLLAGDLQIQCVGTSQGLLGFGIPYAGLYGACSTCGEGLMLASLALAVPGGVDTAAVVTTSHYCAAERQYRTPLEYGSQRPPTAQWTATAGGAFLLGREPGPVQVEAVMAGRMVDSGLRDAGNMGAAMAPAAADSLLCYLEERGETLHDYDAVITGDLAKEGSALFRKLLEGEGVLAHLKHFDCGTLLYDYEKQDVHAGASGCGCSAAVLAAHFFPRLARGEWNRVLFLATGAMMSPSSLQQGGNILGVAPVVALRRAGAVKKVQTEKGEKER